MDATERTISTVASGSKKFAFNADESQHSFKTTDKNITVVCTEGKHDRGSSKIKLVNVVNFKWEQKNYPGRLIACHKDCFLLAYSIRVTKQSKSEGMVRVTHLDLPERGLIKGLSDEILDLQFSHNSNSECLLGIIERTTLHVHEVLVKGDKVTTALKVKIVDPLEGHVPICDRITWCPYLGDGTDFNDEFAKQLLVWTRGSVFQCYSISVLSKAYIDTTDLKASDIVEGGFKAVDGDATITGSVFSDDGTTLALSSSDGLIRFYQVYQHANDRSPRRLHLWKPHDGKPITSFFFLDNYTETVSNKTIWKHAITCAENNAEIKVWCCESWECLQMVRLTSPVDATLYFKAELDISSTYLVLTERSTRQIYVLQIRKGQATGEGSETVVQSKKPATAVAKDGGGGGGGGTRSVVQPYIVSIAEYPMSASVLGFAILYATTGSPKYGDYDDDEDDEQGSPKNVLIRMFLVQPNNLQDCTLMYEAIPDSESEPLTKELPDELAVATRNVVEASESGANSSSVSSSSASNDTTDNNVSHGPSEEDDRSLDDAATKGPGAKVDGKSGGSITTLNNGSDNAEDEEEEEDGSNSIVVKMAEAAQKLNDVFVTIRTANSSTEGGTSANVGGTSAPTTPGSSGTKVNLMTPDSFSTPASGTRSAGKENVKDVRIINLSELPYPEMETLMNQYDRRTAAASGRRRGRGSTTANTTATTTTGARKANSSVTSTASANGSVSSSDSSSSESSDEQEGGGGNTSVASIAGSERVANITDDPDDVDGDEEDTDAEPKVMVSKQGKRKAGKRAFALANGSSSEQSKSRKQIGHGTVTSSGQPTGGGVITVSGTSLTMEHFTKILTLDETEPPTVREKIKSDETVNPDVLSTLFMLAKATKQQQPPVSVAEMVASAGQKVNQPTTVPTTDALEAFVNMVKNRSETSDDSTNGKAKHRNSANGPGGGNMEEDSVPDAPTVPPMPSAEMLASGGSSPSREVQQIMSTKGPVISMVEDLFLYSCVERKDDYDEEEEDEEEEDDDVVNRFDEEDGVIVVANGTADNPDELLEKEDSVEPDVADASVLLSEEKATVAASALKEPDGVSVLVQEAATKRQSTSTMNAESQGEESVRDVEPNDAPASSGFWPSTVPTDVPAAAAAAVADGKETVNLTPLTLPPPTIMYVPDSSKEIAVLNDKLDRMMDIMVAQSRQIEQLNGQLDRMKNARAEEQRKNSAAMNRFTQTLPKTVETQVSGLLVQHSAKMEQTLVGCFNNQQARLAETLTHLPQAMMAQLQGHLLQALTQEMHQKMLPAINAKLDLLQRTVATDPAEKPRITEATIRDSIQRALRGEPFMKAMTTAIQTGMHTVLNEVYQQSLREVILPTYSKHCGELFKQLSTTFSYGTCELIRQVDKHLEHIAKVHDRTTELVQSVQHLPKELSSTADQATVAAIRTMRENIEKDMRALHNSLLKSVREHIRQEIEKGFEAQASSLEDSVLSVVRSQAQTPAPSNLDVQDQIKQYLNGGQINKAFHKALLSNDLNLVEFLLDRADHKQVFNPCPLEQTVLLSLIQQISADMAHHNELKHKYLSDAIVNLDFQDPITKEHSPKVIKELVSNCHKFMAADPQNPLCTSLKMLVIAVQYMGFKNT